MQPGLFGRTNYTSGTRPGFTISVISSYQRCSPIFYRNEHQMSTLYHAMPAAGLVLICNVSIRVTFAATNCNTIFYRVLSPIPRGPMASLLLVFSAARGGIFLQPPLLVPCWATSSTAAIGVWLPGLPWSCLADMELILRYLG